jgi:hypothetical protein
MKPQAALNAVNQTSKLIEIPMHWQGLATVKHIAAF